MPATLRTVAGVSCGAGTRAETCASVNPGLADFTYLKKSLLYTRHTGAEARRCSASSKRWATFGARRAEPERAITTAAGFNFVRAARARLFGRSKVKTITLPSTSPAVALRGSILTIGAPDK